jgi:hypothetical protein
LRHAWEGDTNSCDEARGYFKQLDRRREERARNLARLTGWRIGDIHKRMKMDAPTGGSGKWWDKLWGPAD